MEVLNISLDENEADTSHDELEEDHYFGGAEVGGSSSSTPFRRKYIPREGITDSVELAKIFKEWERPPVPDGSLLYSSSPLEAQPDTFRFLFLDSVSSVSSIKHPSIKLEPDIWRMPLRTVMRLFGVAKVPVYSESQDLFDQPDFKDPKGFSRTHSVSVCCNVHGFVPYFYSLPTIQFLENSEFYRMKDRLYKVLNEKVCEKILQDLRLVHLHDFINGNHRPVVKIEGLPLEKVANCIFHFPSIGNRSKDSLVLKVYVALPMFVFPTAKVLDELSEPCEFQNFEYALTNNIRFLTDQNIPGCSWLELMGGKYFHRTRNDINSELEVESNTQIELDVHYENIALLADQPEDIPPLRILSFDIECIVKDAETFTHGQVIQVGAVLSTYGVTGDPIIGKAAFVLGTCEALPDAKVVTFYDKSNPNNNSEENLLHSEALMLASFRDFVIQMDPDIITGYNIKNFDFPYLIERAEKLYHQFEDIKRFVFLGRLKKVKASIRPVVNEDKKLYQYDKRIVNIPGRIVMDMFPLYMIHDTRRYGRHSLKLKNVAKRNLSTGDEKDDVQYTEINSLQNGDSKTRKRLAKYCVQDSLLPVKLMLVQMPDRTRSQDFLEYYFEKSRLGGTILRYLTNKSKEYDKYCKQVRVQKNDGRVKYHPDSPPKKNQLENGTRKALVSSPAPELETTPIPTTAEATNHVPPKPKKYIRMLFTDDDD